MTTREVLLETLNKLEDEEFEKFKWFLCHAVVREGFKPIQKGELEKANRSNTVDLMVSHYDTDILIVAREVFKKIKRVDLVRKISGYIKEPTDTKRDTEQPEDWLLAVREQLIDGLSDVNVNQILDRLYDQHVFNAQEKNVIRAQIGADKARKLIEGVHRKGPEAVSILKAALHEVDPFLFRPLNLTQTPIIFTPEMQTESAQVSYRFRCAGPGEFQCAETGLVFDMIQGAELQYRIVQWNESRHKPTDKKAAGPMFDIQCSEDAAVRQLHFPHCETKDALRIDGLLSVVHITDDGMDILKPLRIADTHVVVEVAHLSLFGLIWDAVKRWFSLPVNGQVLLFLRSPKRGPRTLHVFLLQKNVPVSQVAAQQGNAEYIPITVNCSFITGQSYSLRCEQEGLKIQPEHASFSSEFGPHFHPTFEVSLKTNPDVVTLIIQDQEGTEVWKHDVHLKEMDPEQSVQPENWMRPVWRQLIDGLSEANVNQILDSLYDQGVINEEEKDVIRAKIGADKARQLIDSVHQKGPDAVSVLKTALREVDPSLFRNLNLV